MSAKLFAVVCIVANALVWLPGCYLSFVAWFTKFSGNSSVETTVARLAGITPILGVILSALAIAALKSSSGDVKHAKPYHLLIMSTVCAAPLFAYTTLKLF
jgi:hypothetical protein